MRKRWSAGGAALGLGILVIACGEPTAEEQLRAATEALVAAENAASEARQVFDAREADLQRASAARDEAAAELRDAERTLGEAKASVGLHATDELLFRSVQKLLLEDSGLRDIAIRAVVSQGAVTLSGESPTLELRDRAVELAGSVPGVTEVTSRIAVLEKTPTMKAAEEDTGT
jgi:osmotically-inducible protein OsmY